MIHVPRPPSGFDWDPNKYAANLVKHGIKFDQAIGTFSDPNGFDYDLDWIEGEARYGWLGGIQGVVLYIAYVIRGSDDELTRIISARNATRAETDAYFAR